MKFTQPHAHAIIGGAHTCAHTTSTLEFYETQSKIEAMLLTKRWVLQQRSWQPSALRCRMRFRLCWNASNHAVRPEVCSTFLLLFFHMFHSSLIFSDCPFCIAQFGFRSAYPSQGSLLRLILQLDFLLSVYVRYVQINYLKSMKNDLSSNVWV